MTLSEDLKKIGLVSLIVLIIDILWLSAFLGGYFGKMVLKIQGEEMKLNYNIAGFAYLFIILSFYYFIVMKDNGNMELDAFLLGLFIYGIFEFTSGAIFQKWEILPLFVDTIWGGILYLVTYYIYNQVYPIKN